MPLKTIGWISWKPGSGSVAGIPHAGERIADLDFRGALDIRDEVTDIPSLQLFPGRGLRA